MGKGPFPPLGGGCCSCDPVRRGGGRSPTWAVNVRKWKEKAAHVMGIMKARLFGLKLSWEHVTAVDIYTAYPLHPILEETILRPLQQAVIHGAGTDFPVDPHFQQFVSPPPRFFAPIMLGAADRLQQGSRGLSGEKRA